jgi:hypothetical protein
MLTSRICSLCIVLDFFLCVAAIWAFLISLRLLAGPLQLAM